MLRFDTLCSALRRFRTPGLILVGSLLASSLAAIPPASAQLAHQTPEISGGAEMNLRSQRAPVRAPFAEPEETPIPGLTPLSFTIGPILEAYSFLDNPNLNDGQLFIPPDPMGAAGQLTLLATVNTGIECRDKATGSLLWISSLRNFFSPLGGSTLGTYTFDPKITYDYYQDRFVVVTLEQTLASGSSVNASRILIAVSKTYNPSSPGAVEWWYYAIDSKVNISGNFYWADYPGLEVDEEAVYITANLFPFTTGSSAVRLWIINKGVSGGFYGGGPATVNIYNPIAGGGANLTMMPAQVWGASGAGTGIGTYLVGYDGLSNGGVGGQEKVQIIRVNDPLGSPTFTLDQPSVGDIENYGGSYGFPALPDAPQLGGTTRIEVNDRRALDAVWRDNALWFTTTINPNAGDPANAGETTAHWFKINTSAVTSGASPAGLLTLADQGNIGGEDLATDTWTFFPSVAVNSAGEAEFGFSASAATLYCGAYAAGRHAPDPPGAVQASKTIRVGRDYYVRTFSGTRNRWGDYSGISIDPVDGRIFWVFNEYAWTRGTPTGDGDGRWKTAWRPVSASCLTVSCPGNTSGHRGAALGLSFCITNCGALSEVMSYTLSDPNGWCAPLSSSVSVGAGETMCVPATCNIPSGACPPAFTTLKFRAVSSVGKADSCTVIVSANNAPPVALCQNLTLPGGGTCSVAVLPSQVNAGSSDPDGDAIGLSLLPAGPFSQGVTPVVLTVTDPCGASDTCSATITVTCPVGPHLEVHPSTVLIASVALGDTACRSLVVKNTGDENLVVLSVTGCNSGWFSLDLSALTTPVAAGDSTSFRVCYVPLGAGPDSCEVTVVTNDSTAVIPVHVATVTAVAGEGAPARFLARAFPNPFESSMRIRFSLPAESTVRVDVFDSQGRKVRALRGGTLPAGEHDLLWDGADDRGVVTARGMYFVRVETPQAVRTIRAVKLR